MALEEFVGAITLEWDGRDIDCVSLQARESTGRKLVKTMSKTGNAAGFVKGVKQYDLTVVVVVPADGNEPKWADLEGAKLTQEPIAGGQRVSYLDCFSTDVSESYEVEGEARRTIQLHAIKKVEE
jgi:hypothetical protein